MFYIRRKTPSKDIKKEEDKNGISRGSGWIKVRISYLSCLSFVLVGGRFRFGTGYRKWLYKGCFRKGKEKLFSDFEIVLRLG